MKLKAPWEQAKQKYHYPSLSDPEVGKFSGGACFNFRTLKTLVDEEYIQRVCANSGLSEERVLDGVFTHEIGHYMVFPRTYGILILAAKMINDFFKKEKEDLQNFIFQTYGDMVDDVDSVLKSSRCNSILDIRTAAQKNYADRDVNGKIRAVMLAYLKKQARIDYELEDELKPFLEKMMEIDFRDVVKDHQKMREGIFLWGNIILSIIKEDKKGIGCQGVDRQEKEGEKSGEESNSADGKGNAAEPRDMDIKEVLKGMNSQQIKDALREISLTVTKGEYEQVKKWLNEKGVELPNPRPAGQGKGIGTSSGELEVDWETVRYHAEISRAYPLIIVKKPIDTKKNIRSYTRVEKWRPGTDPSLMQLGNSGGMILPGITTKIKPIEIPIKSVDYKAPHLLLEIDSSGSMINPKLKKSPAVVAGDCAARSYHINDSYVGVLNFSGDTFYLPYTRDLDAVFAAITAFQGGGTTVDMEMLKKMLGKDRAELYEKQVERNIRHMLGEIPVKAVRKNISVSVPEEIFTPGSIDVIMITDGGISNLGETLDFLEERSEVNRATIFLVDNPFGFEGVGEREGKITVKKIGEDLSGLPGMVMGAVKRHFSNFAEELMR
jgi:hypothetical protein